MKACDFLPVLGRSIKSVAKMALKSRRATVKDVHHGGELVVLANGPSLNDTMRLHMERIKGTAAMTVNFAPLAPEFSEIRPAYHIMADPVFFEGKHHNLPLLEQALAAVDWPLTLLVPVSQEKRLAVSIKANPCIQVRTFNFVGVEGFHWLEDMAYSHGWGMPRPRNVLVPALMCGMALGYTEIYVAGADHSWMRTLSVDRDNNVISVQPHFYKDDDNEQKRVDTTYRGYRLHDIVYSFYVAFRSYHGVRRYADHRGVRIYNVTPGSMIDAFERREL